MQDYYRMVRQKDIKKAQAVQRKINVQIGDYVTCKRLSGTMYSGYAGRPIVEFKPGMVGRVGAIDVPAVRVNKNFICADFFLPNVKTPSGDKHRTNHEWRVQLYYDNVKVVPKPEILEIRSTFDGTIELPVCEDVEDWQEGRDYDLPATEWFHLIPATPEEDEFVKNARQGFYELLEACRNERKAD